MRVKYETETETEKEENGFSVSLYLSLLFSHSCRCLYAGFQSQRDATFTKDPKTVAYAEGQNLNGSSNDYLPSDGEKVFFCR